VNVSLIPPAFLREKQAEANACEYGYGDDSSRGNVTDYTLVAQDNVYSPERDWQVRDIALCESA